MIPIVRRSPVRLASRHFASVIVFNAETRLEISKPSKVKLESTHPGITFSGLPRTPPHPSSRLYNVDMAPCLNRFLWRQNPQT